MLSETQRLKEGKKRESMRSQQERPPPEKLALPGVEHVLAVAMS